MTTTSNKKTIAISTVTQHRVGVFTGGSKNSWGEAEVSGDIGPEDQDLLEKLFLAATQEKGKISATKDGKLTLIFDFYSLDKKSGHYDLIEKRINKLQQTLITIKRKKKDTDWTLIEQVPILIKFSKIQRKTKNGGCGLRRLTMARRGRVEFSREWSELMSKDVAMHYLPLIPIILSLACPQTRTLARFLLTHSSDQKITKDQALGIMGLGDKKEGVDATKKEKATARAARRAWRNLCLDPRISRLGITVSGRLITYHRPAGIYFSLPRRT